MVHCMAPWVREGVQGGGSGGGGEARPGNRVSRDVTAYPGLPRQGTNEAQLGRVDGPGLQGAAEYGTRQLTVPPGAADRC